MSNFSPLRYPGGKGRFAPQIYLFANHNKILGGNYVEPYAGGAGVALYLLLKEYVWNVVINDLDKRVYAVWHSILNNTDSFIEKIKNTTVSIDDWKVQKEIIKYPDDNSLLDLGFATFFINRTARSGILNAGPIGGNNQAGDYKIDVRFNKSELIKRINLLSLYKNRVTVRNLDALEVIDEFDKPETFFYLDPPYFEKGSNLYKNSYGADEHEAVRNKINTLESPWVITYDNVSEIRFLYKEHDIVDFDLYYSANNLTKRRGSEIIIKPKSLTTPKNWLQT